MLCGFDPTADSLHIGSLIPIILLMHFEKAGHKPIALVGGATGMIGDPSGKSDERNLLDEETLAKNVAGIKSVLSRFLDFDSQQENAPLLVNGSSLRGEERIPRGVGRSLRGKERIPRGDGEVMVR